MPQVAKLLQEYLKKFDVVLEFDEKEVEHWLVPREDVVESFVVEDPETKLITDFVSFYSLPSTIIGNKKYDELRAAYSFYNVATKTPLTQLMKDSLISAKNSRFDVFNCLDLMENQVFLKELKFGKGDGCLQYYLYNWKCRAVPPEKMGIVLL